MQVPRIARYVPCDSTAFLFCVGCAYLRQFVSYCIRRMHHQWRTATTRLNEQGLLLPVTQSPSEIKEKLANRTKLTERKKHTRTVSNCCNDVYTRLILLEFYLLNCYLSNCLRSRPYSWIWAPQSIAKSLLTTLILSTKWHHFMHNTNQFLENWWTSQGSPSKTAFQAIQVICFHCFSVLR